jgi:hypothetical protein
MVYALHKFRHYLLSNTFSGPYGFSVLDQQAIGFGQVS